MSFSLHSTVESSAASESYADSLATASCSSSQSTSLDGDSESDVDLQELYESFDYNETASEGVSSSGCHGCAQEQEGLLHPDSQLTVFQSYLLTFQYALRHSLTAKGLTELLQLISVHSPKGAAIPTSVHNLKKYFVETFPSASPVQHAYCSSCQRPLPSIESSCDGDGCTGGCPAVFITIPIAAQIKAKMEDQATWSALQQRFSRVPTRNISDVYDGKGYRKYADFLSKPASISLLLNTDGVALYRSSSVSIWPVWAVINELPPNQRFLKQHMLLLAIFYSAEKPTMNMFLRPVIDDINDVYQTGVPVETPDGSFVARAILLGCAFDLPARAIVLNMKQWNGAFGCLYCTEKGYTAPGDHLHRYWPHQGVFHARTHGSLLQNAVDTVTNGTPECGVKGPSVLALHPCFDLVQGVVIDDLHGVFLGVTLSLLNLWFSKGNRGEPYFIGNKIHLCNERLLSIKVTDSISRLPRRLEEYNRWKGSELRNWLLFFSLPVLREILPSQFFDHLALLVAAIYIFSSECISEQDFLLGRHCLQQFYEKFSTLYGVKATSMNCHLLNHLPDCVQQWGPLWAYSCFHFENMNGQLKYLFHGTKNMTKQMAFSFIMMQTLPVTLTRFEQSPPAVSALARILSGKKQFVKQVISSGITVLGGISFKILSPSVLQALNHCLNSNGLEPAASTSVATLYRVDILGKIFYSRSYQRVKKRNSYTVSYISSHGDKQYAFVDYFVYVHNKVYAILTPLTLSPVSVEDHFNISIPVPFSQVREDDDSVEVCPVENLDSKCVFINFGPYVVEFPSKLTFD